MKNFVDRIKCGKNTKYIITCAMNEFSIIRKESGKYSM